MTDDPAVPGALKIELREIRGHLCSIEKDDPSTARAIRNCVSRLEAALIAARREPPPETTMVALTEAEIQGLCDYVRWHGSAHVEGCPCDDTCDCIARPLNDAVNAICRKAFDAQVLAVGRPTPPEAEK